MAGRVEGRDLPARVVRDAPAAAEGAAEEVRRARDFALAEKAAATRRAYRSDFLIFSGWCAERGVEPLRAAPEAVGAFLAAQAGRGMTASTVARRLAAIRYAYALKGLEPPTGAEAVKAVARGIRRALGTAPRRKAPATDAVLAAMLEHVPDDRRGRRDRALLLLGFAGALRRGELVALRVEDLTFLPEGLRVRIRRSKTDQEGRGQEIAIPNGSRLKPVAAVEEWLADAGITEGHVLRRLLEGGRVTDQPLSTKSVADIVKRHAGAAGLDPAEFSGHSLRAGFITSAAEAGEDALRIAEVSRHRSLDVLRGYVRRSSLFKEHAGEGFL